MYRQLYLESKEKYEKLKYEKLKERQRPIMTGGANANADANASRSNPITKITIYGFNGCPHFERAEELAHEHFSDKEIKAVEKSELQEKYKQFLALELEKSNFKIYNTKQRFTSPQVIIYENGSPIMYGGCDTFEEYLKQIGKL
jgi:glutaredoxin